MYLIHMPLLMSLGLWVTRQAQKAGLSYLEAVGVSFVVFIAAVMAISVLFERFVDAPSIRLANLVAGGGDHGAGILSWSNPRRWRLTS